MTTQVRKTKKQRDSETDEFQSLIDQVIANGLDPSVFDLDIDIKFAKNCIEFALSPDYMNISSVWARQAELAVRMFAEWCPDCTDKDFWEDVPVDATMSLFKSKVCLLEHGVCPRCGKEKTELFDKLPWEMVACLGQRSGKTAVTAGIIALLCS